ncbi:MAG: hypothetical protein KKD01_01240 [Proteobacteria bacterium]|nr:hypothetical protein [Pseudomonadota bacterium]MBU1418272.1 hypothetical protein [Pseudomonadota bacterium]MBU1453324.1 hypothetical protein [Pseudomonadota bacterium]
MTNRDVIVTILSEASGKPVDEVRSISDAIFSQIPSKTKIDDELSDDAATALLSSLRSELPGVRRWLVEGGLMAEADIAAACGKMN